MQYPVVPTLVSATSGWAARKSSIAAVSVVESSLLTLPTSVISRLRSPSSENTVFMSNGATSPRR